MFIIYNFRQRTTKKYGRTYFLQCSICYQKNFFEYERYRYWFSLFAIPLIPHSTHHFLICPNCEGGVRLKGDKLPEAAERLSKKTDRLMKGKITKEEYLRETSIFRELMKAAGLITIKKNDENEDEDKSGE